MSAVQRSPSVTTKHRSTFANATVVGTLVAVAVAMLFILSLIAGHASNHTRTAVRTEGRYAPLIQYRGTGQPPAAAPHAPDAGGAANDWAAQSQHSYGAVP